MDERPVPERNAYADNQFAGTRRRFGYFSSYTRSPVGKTLWDDVVRRLGELQRNFGRFQTQGPQGVAKQIELKMRGMPLFCGVLAMLLIAAGAALAQPPGLAAPDPTGEWLVAQKYARIRVVDCSGRLWGVVAWEAKPGIDSNNPDPSLRARPTLGMPILLGMVRTKQDQWDGQIYNSQDGHTYAASISLADPDTLQVQGCFLGFLCGGENWTRVAPPDSAVAAQSSARKSPPVRRPPNARQPAVNGSGANAAATTGEIPPESANDICLRIVGVPGLAH
jgi:uncharacterized protein (DUF2147 family)